MAESTTTTIRRETSDESTEIEQPQSRRRGVIVIVVVLVVLVALGLWWRSTFSEDTDDAQINGHLIQISSRIAGQVLKVDVEENQVVKAGDVIAELDPRDYQVAVENAEAALASAQAAAVAAQVNVPITTINTGSNLRSAESDVSGARASIEQAQQQLEAAQARVAQAEANNIKAQADLARYKPLVEKDVISKQQYDAAVAAADAAKAALADAKASQQAAAEGVRVARDRETQAQALYKYAQTGPQQVAAQNCARQPGRGPGETGAGPARSGQAQPQLHQNRRARRRHHHPQERRNQPERLRRTEPAHAGLPRGSLDHRKLQRDAAPPHAARPGRQKSTSTPPARTTRAR